MNILLTILTALTLLFIPSTANADTTVTAPTASITAPIVALPYDSPTVSTSPATEPQVAPLPIGGADVGAPILSCEEDMECWAGSANDNRVHDTATEDATASPEALTASPEDAAWLSLQSIGDIEVLQDHILEYKGTHTTEPTVTAGQFPVMDTETPNVWHVFEYVRIWAA